MFGYKKLIFAVLLTGCATQAADAPIDLLEETTEEPTISVDLNNDLLESVESTLGVADEAIEEILEEKIQARNTISTLQKTVSYEENLISTLEGSSGEKDSLLLTYEKNNQLLEEKIIEVAINLDHALHKCTTECSPAIKKLNKENQELLAYVDSLQNQVYYLDSLVSTNKKLSKKLAKHEIR